MRRAFTLLEILVTVAIIGLLAALLLPVLSRVRELGRRTSCVSNLHQVGLGFAMYRTDHGQFPPQFSDLGRSYAGDVQVFICPSDRVKGQLAGNLYLEGNTYLPSGISYEYFPRWQKAADNGWWQPAPAFGNGRWDDLTPLAGCPWHWAKKWNPEATENLPGVTGWELILTAGGSVRKIRIEEPLAEFTPQKYQ